MAYEHKDGEGHESGGGAYEFPPLEKLGKDAQYRAAGEPRPTYGGPATPPAGYGPAPVPPPGAPSGYGSAPGAPSGYGSVPAPQPGWGPGGAQQPPPAPGAPAPGAPGQLPPGSPPIRPPFGDHRNRAPLYGAGNRYPMKDAPGPLGKIGVFTPLVGVVVAFVVLSTLSTGGGLWPSTDSASERTTTTTAPPATSTRATTTGRPTPTTRSAAVTAALLPGYQGIAVESRGVAYDVPEGWVVDSPSTIRGFENEQGRISGTGTAAEGEDYCGENNRATSFVSRSDVPDLAAAATEWGDSTARIAFDSSGWTRRVTGPENLTTRSGLTGAMVETTGPQTPDPADCATAYSIYTFAFTGSEGTTLLLTIAADREVTGEVTPDQAREIFSTVRLLN